jgi:predicted nuclease of predicted toxin-antitoxin system
MFTVRRVLSGRRTLHYVKGVLMQFLLDMGISNLVGTWLQSRGFDTIHIRDNGLNRLEDVLIVEKAIVENRIILTSDMDFGQILSNKQTHSVSLVQFRVSDFTAANIIRKLELLFEEFSEQLGSAYLFTVEDNRIRLRKLPI